MSNRVAAFGRVVIAGQGYVGLPLALHAARRGHTVVGYDVDEERIAQLKDGHSFVTDVSDTDLRSVTAVGRYRATADEGDLHGFDIALICVPTPTIDGEPDLQSILACAKTLGRYLAPECCVVLESSTYPGTTREQLVPVLEDASGLTAGEDFYVGYSPERIDPGNRVWGLGNTPKVVSGINDRSLTVIESFYRTLVDTVVPVSTPEVAEFAKLYENASRFVNIALVNEMVTLGHAIKVDVREALDASATKPFGYPVFRPGPGIGGHCLPVNAQYLSWYLRTGKGHGSGLLNHAISVNEGMPQYVVHRLLQGLSRRGSSLREGRILLLGLAYKQNVADFRGSPALRVLDLLAEQGFTVQFAEPDGHVIPFAVRNATRVPLTNKAVAAADAVVVLTDHDAFPYDVICDNARYILDTRGRLRGPTVETL